MQRPTSGALSSLRARVNLIAFAVALVVALCIPLGYGFVAYRYEAESVASKARLNAGRVAQYIYANDRMWQYQKVRIQEIIELNGEPGAVGQRLLDHTNKLVLTNGSVSDRFQIVQSAPIIVASALRGRVEVAIPLTPLLLQIGTVAFFSSVIAFAAYFSVRVYPLRVLDRTLGQLEVAIRSAHLANTSLRDRTERLADSHRLGRLGDWSYRIGDADVHWAPETFELLGYDPATFRPRRGAVLSLHSADGIRRILDAQAEVVRTGTTKAVDVKVKRADGSEGDFVLMSKPITDAESRVVGFSGTIQDISERKNAEEQLEKLAYYDPLTGLANRALFSREVVGHLSHCYRTGAQGALLLLDLDRFKEVNDSLGHAAGDELLAKVGHLIARTLNKGQFLARLGGDEFAIIVPRFDGLEDVDRLASKVIAAVSGLVRLERGEVSVGTSIGVVLTPRDGTNLNDLLRNADLALYSAKEAGRGCFVHFKPEMNAAVQHKIALARDLRSAVNDNTGLSIHYQPQVDLSTGRVTGYEALMRWNHATRGNVPPSEFIPVAESSRLICELGQWVLRHAAIQAKAWLDAGEPPREVAVNVSVAQIWHTDLATDVARVLEETGLPAHLLCLELTESLLADHTEGRTRTVLEALKKLGVTLALDDFGTDYSSLGYLKQLPFDKLKIDRMFVDGAPGSKRSEDLLKGIIELGRGLGMKVVGEGAETPEEAAMLMELGCDLAQGFVFARPVLATEALQYARACEETPYDGDTGSDPLIDISKAFAARLRAAAA